MWIGAGLGVLLTAIGAEPGFAGSGDRPGGGWDTARNGGAWSSAQSGSYDEHDWRVGCWFWAPYYCACPAPSCPYPTGDCDCSDPFAYRPYLGQCPTRWQQVPGPPR